MCVPRFASSPKNIERAAPEFKEFAYGCEINDPKFLTKIFMGDLKYLLCILKIQYEDLNLVDSIKSLVQNFPETFSTAGCNSSYIVDSKARSAHELLYSFSIVNVCAV